MKTIKRDFQAEAQRAGFTTLEELNSALWAWLDVEYNRRNHSSTGEPPAVRFEKGLPSGHRRVQDLEWFENLFLLQVFRKVAKWGTIKFEGNQYHTVNSGLKVPLFNGIAVPLLRVLHRVNDPDFQPVFHPV